MVWDNASGWKNAESSLASLEIFGSANNAMTDGSHFGSSHGTTYLHNVIVAISGTN